MTVTISSLLVVPCYNEAKRFLLKDFEAAVEAFPELGFILVDDGSRDATRSLLDAFVQKHPSRATSFSLPQNQGKAEAVRQGFLKAFDEKATLPWDRSMIQHIGYWDSDLATPLTELSLFLKTFHKKPELFLVMGARIKLLGRDITRHAGRHYLGRLFATAASCVLRLAVYDTQCGAKLFRYQSLTKSLFEQPFINSWIFDVEILARLSMLHPALVNVDGKSLIYELPLRSWQDVAGSKVKPSDFIKALIGLIRIAWRYPLTPANNHS